MHTTEEKATAVKINDCIFFEAEGVYSIFISLTTGQTTRMAASRHYTTNVGKAQVSVRGIQRCL